MKKCFFLLTALAAASTTFGSILANEKYVTNTVNTVVYNASTQIIEKVITDTSITNAGAVAVSKDYTNTKVAETLVTAAEDATAKTNAVLNQAKSYADTQDSALKSTITGDIATAKNSAVYIASTNATAKANAAEANANASTDTKIGVLTEETVVAEIGAAKTAAIADAGTAADGKINAYSNKVESTFRKIADSYTKNEVDTAVEGAKTFASNADEAVSNNVLSIAATTAQSKADAAQLAAETTASNKLEAAKTELNSAIVLKDDITSVDAKITAVSNNVVAIAVKNDGVISNNLETIAQTKATTAKTEAIQETANYFADPAPVAGKVDVGGTEVDIDAIYTLEDHKTITITVDNTKSIAIKPPVYKDPSTYTKQRSATVVVDVTVADVSKMFISSCGSNQSIVFGEQNVFQWSDITGSGICKFMLYYYEVQKNVFWLQIEQFVDFN